MTPSLDKTLHHILPLLPNWSLWPNFSFYSGVSGSHRTYAMVVVYQERIFVPPYTEAWSYPTLRLAFLISINKIFKSLQNHWHMVTDITSFGKRLERSIGHTLNFFANWVQYRFKNKTNHPISSNSHPSATAKGGGVRNQQEHHIILTKYEAVHPTAVSENNSSSGMLII